MIGIIDADLGNLQSIRSAVYELGFDPILLTDSNWTETLTHLIIPGVGNFSHAMKSLNKSGMASQIKEFVNTGKPVLGVCLGMQLLATKGYEGGETEGLDIVPGTVERIEQLSDRRIPHVGWNVLNKVYEHPVLNNITDGHDFYYVHSFEFHCDDVKNNLGNTDYFGPISVMVAKENVVGCQFHPEKSQNNGLLMLENFCKWNGQV